MTTSSSPPSFVAAWRDAFEATQERIAHATKYLAQSIAPSIAAFAEDIRKLPDEIRPGIRALAQRGWFISGEMGIAEIREFANLTLTERFEEIDEQMSTWIDEQQTRILKSASLRFPDRVKVLSAAFEAHASKVYELSVPVLLIQVEGMCIEVLGRKLFATKAGIPRTKEATDALVSGAFSEVIFLPLREVHGLTASENMTCPLLPYHRFVRSPGW
jgi:hypothetical protein